MVLKIVKYNYTCQDCGCKFSANMNLGANPACPECSGLLDEIKDAVEDAKLKQKLVGSIITDIESYQGNLISIIIKSPEGRLRKIYVDDEDCYGCESVLGIFE